MNLFTELKRRNVFRVGIAYLLGGWVLLQGADFALDVIGAPNWIIQVLVLLAIIGLPAVLIFAWVFEMTPEGLKRESEVDRSRSIAPQTGRKLNYVITGTLILIILVMGAERWYLAQGPATVSMVPVSVEPNANEAGPETLPKSVAVLPFADLSQAGDQQWFADGLAEEILNALAKTPDLLVSSRTASFRYRGSQQELPQIAAELGVAHILEGSVRSAGDRIRVTAQLIRASDGFHIWSENYDRDVADMITIQEDLARNIALALETTMDPDALAAMTRVGTQSVEAYQAMLRGMALEISALDSFEGQRLLDALEQFEKARAADPDFAYAHLRIASWWKQQKNPSYTASELTGLNPTELQERFDEAIGEAIDHAPTDLDRKGYQALEAEVNLRFGQALKLYSEYLDARPQEDIAWLGMLSVAGVLSDRAAMERVLDHTRENGLRDPFYATLYVGEAYKYRNPGEVADYGLAALQRWPGHSALLYQTHRALMWAGRAEEGAEIRRQYVRNNEPSPVMELRQACIEGRLGDAESILATVVPGKVPSWRSNRWLMLLMLDRREEATELIRHYDTEASVYELTGFMSYMIFDARPFRSLDLLMQREGIRRPLPVEVPYKCPPPSPPSVAVLPFVNMSADPDNEYFSDGISEELLNLLVRIDGLRVPSRTSSFAFKGMNTDIKEIARQLDVGHVLEGSVRKAGNRVRITAQLIDVDTDTHLWSETYDRELEDIFAIQDEIAGHIVEALQLVLGPDQAGEKTAQSTANLGAYESYLRGRYLFLQRGVVSLTEAVAALRSAVEQDPDFADAWAALAQTGVTLAGWDPANAEQHMAQVDEAANRALELDPDSATALSALGLAHFNRLEWLEGFEYLQKAASIARDSTPVYWYGLFLQSAGYLKEAEQQLKAAERMDPVYPQLQYGLGLSALDRNDVEAARHHMQNAIDGNNPNGEYGMSFIYFLEGNEDGMRRILMNLLETFDEGILVGSREQRAAVESILAALDDPGRREQGIASARAIQQMPLLGWFEAQEEILGAMQDMLQAGMYLELAPALGQSTWMPAFAEVRQLPGFKPFMQDVGLIDLWRERGWPDRCRPLGKNDFECD
jgi:TolB-like protein